MTEIRFYHLTTRPLESALPEILEKVYERDQRAVVKAPDQKTIERLSDRLWSYKKDSFLPHGAKKDGHPEKQPVWLTDQDENPNNASILILTGGTETDTVSDYELCCEMLDGHNEEHIKAARKRWKHYKEAGYDLAYWKQDSQGRWQKQDI